MTQENKIDWSKYHLEILIPCYGGMAFEGVMMGLVSLAKISEKIGLTFNLRTMSNESLIPRGRNGLIAQAMTNKAATHFMFIDADIRFHPDMILHLLLADEDIVGGLYPKKQIPERYVVNGVSGGQSKGPLFECATIGTGFMMMKRSVIEKMIVHYKHLKYNNDVGLPEAAEEYLYALFDCEVVNKVYMSEDWLFCQRWRDMGGKVWAHASIHLDHQGFYTFKGGPDALARAGVLWKQPQTQTPVGETK
tara:strand:+ start:118 stop:864 length:747 start_codon:yes stop_codon:yes gene_type:complete